MRLVQTDANVPTAEMQYHELAGIFPMMTDDELAALVADIKEHGLRDPIVTWQGKILDGRNRYRACTSLNIKPNTIEWNGVGVGSAQAFVVSHNLHRRHLNESQRAMIGAKLATLKRGNSVKSEGKKANTGIPVLRMRDAAEILNVNKETIGDARKVLEEATPEEIAAVESGKAAVSTLAKQLRKNVPAVERRATRESDPNDERREALRANGRLWRLLREALENLTNLPRPADVVRVARAIDRGNVVNSKLLPATEWLTEFSDAWTSPDTEANSRRKDKSARKTKEDTATTGTARGSS